MMIHARTRVPERSGSILLTVLVVVALLTLTGMKFYQWSFAEHRATRAAIRQTQTRLNAESATEFIKYLLTEDDSTTYSLGGLSNNPARFQGVLIEESDVAALRSRFSVIAPAINNGVYEGVRFGLEDESSRMNLNALLVADARQPDANIGRTMLMGLPGMTESLADAILDWIDADDTPRTMGAEVDYYSSLNPPYAPQNGPLESLDQLLMVRDMNATLLYGADRNRNGIVDAGENAEQLLVTEGAGQGELNRGWSAYMSVYSAEQNRRADGRAKIDVNQEDLQALETELMEIFSTEQTNFILAYRQGGPYDDQAGTTSAIGAAAGGSTPSSNMGSASGGAAGGASVGGGSAGAASAGSGGTEETAMADAIDIDFEAGGSVPIESILDLVGTKTRVTQKGDTQRTIVETPFPNEPGAMTTFLPLMMDNLTSTAEEVLPGRLNINQAPRVLLEAIPGMPLEIVEQILSVRDFEPAPEVLNRQYETWILVEGLVTLEQMKQLMPLVNAGGDVYRAQIVGYYEAEGPATRLEVLVDNTGVLPEVRWTIDLTPVGVGFPVEILGAEPVEIE